jgi:hypothetical protein
LNILWIGRTGKAAGKLVDLYQFINRFSKPFNVLEMGFQYSFITTAAFQHGFFANQNVPKA